MVIQDINMKFGAETAGSLMTGDYIALTEDYTADQAIDYLRDNLEGREDIHYVYVIDDEERLVGVVAMRELLAASGRQPLKRFMKKNLIQLRSDMDQENAAKIFQDTDLVTIPVVSREGYILGVIHVETMLDVIEQEVTEDLHKMASVTQVKPTKEGESYLDLGLLKAPINLLYRKRVVWLVVLVFMNVFSGAGIATYEELIENNVALVFFLPLLVDSGGNAGAQSATLVIRAMALGEVKMRDWFKMIGKESLVAGLLGFTMAMAVSVVGLLRGGVDIAIVVALTMVVVVMIGSIIGLSLPFIFTKLNFDPATASGPLITSICDIVGVFIYFGIANTIIGMDEVVELAETVAHLL